MGVDVIEPRALAAARAVVIDHGLRCEQAAVVYSGSNVLVHLRPAPVVARVMTGTVVLHDDPQRWLDREVSVLSFLAPSGVAIAPSSLIAPGPYQRDGVWMTFVEWVAHEDKLELRDEAERLGRALRDLHEELSTFSGDLGDLIDVRDDIERLRRQLRPTAALSAETIASLHARLLALLDDVVIEASLPAQPLHGDASLSNLLRTPARLVWNDFEDTFRGPVHWDVAGYMMSLRSRGADADFVARALDAYGWADAQDLAPFSEAHDLYGEIWRLYDAQRRP
jgi:Phosphotransferase enzyme family